MLQKKHYILYIIQWFNFKKGQEHNQTDLTYYWKHNGIQTIAIQNQFD